VDLLGVVGGLAGGIIGLIDKSNYTEQERAADAAKAQQAAAEQAQAAATQAQAKSITQAAMIGGGVLALGLVGFLALKALN
jgi:hypothetical protein